MKSILTPGTWKRSRRYKKKPGITTGLFYYICIQLIHNKFIQAMDGITRLLPADLIEAQTVTGAETIAALKTALMPDDRIHDCPKCVVTPEEGDPYRTGMINIDIPEAQGGGTAKVICDVCEGYTKTVTEWESYSEGTAYREVVPEP